MFNFPRLWQRIFAWAILLIVASHAVSFLLFKFDEYAFKERLIDRSVELAAELEGGSIADITIASEFMNHKEPRFWFEKPDGTLIVGRFIFDRHSLSGVIPLSSNSTTVLRSPSHEALYITATPLRTQQGPAIMYLAGRKEETSPLMKLFYQGLITVLILGGVLSARAAWKITQPLSRLCSEVMELAEGNLNQRVTVGGTGEIAQVATAVNQLAVSLSENIDRMRRILANVSHEMRSPLARMNVSLAIIEEGLITEKNLPENAKPDNNKALLAVKHVRSMQKEIDHMERLIGSSLLTSKLALQEQELLLMPIALSELCVEMLRRHDPLLRSKRIAITQHIQPDLWVCGDESLLCMVLSNLLDNAAKYTDEGGRVYCTLSMEQKMVQFSIENSHAPIAQEDLAAIFDPFYRRLGTCSEDGVGLGLALVEKAITIHEGFVKAENTEEGLLFTVKLPVAERPVT